MLTPEEDIEIAALKKRGWTISAIARHTGRDRKTVRAHLNGERGAGVRQRPDCQWPSCSPRLWPWVVPCRRRSKTARFRRAKSARLLSGGELS
jgi:transposase